MGMSIPPPSRNAHPLFDGELLMPGQPVAVGWQSLLKAGRYMLLGGATSRVSGRISKRCGRNFSCGPKRYVNNWRETLPFAPAGSPGVPAGILKVSVKLPYPCRSIFTPIWSVKFQTKAPPPPFRLLFFVNAWLGAKCMYE